MAAARMKSMARTAPETPALLWQRLRADWIVIDDQLDLDGSGFDRPGFDRSTWLSLVDSRLRQLERHAAEHPTLSTSRPLLLIADSNPTDFLASLWAGLLAEWDIALANPSWGQQEWQSASQLLSPTVVWPTFFSCFFSDSSALAPSASASSLASSVSSTCLDPAILIPTGGSSGSIKFAHHTWRSLTTAAIGFCNHFQRDRTPVNAYCVLPLYHVSGLMQVLRTALSGGQLFLSSFKALLSTSSYASTASTCLPQFTYLSLVPTQLKRLLRVDRAAWLRQFYAVLLGGASPWPDLIERAIADSIPLYLSYGMTETGAMITAARAELSLKLSSDSSNSSSLAFKSGLSSGQALPHAVVDIEREGQRLPAGKLGQVVVRSAAIAQSYYRLASPTFAQNTFYTDDIGYLDATGALHITGRASSKIISGGENVFPAEVEAALRSTGQVSDVVVIGVPHPEWGEVVAAAYVPANSTVSPESLKRSLIEGSTTGQIMGQITGQTAGPAQLKSHIVRLSRYKHPKQWIALGRLPRNAQGKLNQAALLAQILPYSEQSTIKELGKELSKSDGKTE